MNSGKYIFSQVVKYLPVYEFEKLVKKYDGDKRTRGFNCYNQFLHLLFGQLTSCESLRDICLCLQVHNRILYHLGFRKTVNSSSLSRANESRDYRIYEEFGYKLIESVRPLYEKETVPSVNLPNDILALDSTTISISIKLCSWALGKYSRGGVKMHTLLDLRGSVPVYIHITDSRWHDSNVLDMIEPAPYTIYTMDKAYVDFKALYKYHCANAYFVTRAKDTMQYDIIETNGNVDESVGLKADQTIRLNGYKSKQHYPENLRLVTVYDSETDEEIRFLTNNFEITALEVANIYRNRWQIEVFFKWIKQNIVIKSLWGYSPNAVKTHLWVAICAYLLVAKIKAICKSELSVTEILTIISVSALEKTDLTDLITKQPKIEISNQNVKELSLYDFLEFN